MGVLYKNDDSGFTTCCPFDIQKLLVDRLCVWSEKPAISKILWEPNSALLLLEICRQVCSTLPIAMYSESIKKCIDLFKSWLLVPFIY
jgi:hypothetical protein